MKVWGQNTLCELVYVCSSNDRYLLCSVKATIERYKKASSDTSNNGSVSEINAQV